MGQSQFVKNEGQQYATSFYRNYLRSHEDQDDTIDASASIQVTQVFNAPGLEVWSVYVHVYTGDYDVYASAFLPSSDAAWRFAEGFVAGELDLTEAMEGES